MDMYASHLPVLSALIRALSVNGRCECIEFGAGYYSTAMIQAVAGRTFEDNAEWYGRLSACYGKIEFVASCIAVAPYEISGFVFIDSAPEFMRKAIAYNWREFAPVVVVHDAEDCWETEHGYIRDLVPLWNRAYKYVGDKPATLILSESDLALDVPNLRSIK
jgi:hypothetical protein